MIGKSKNSSKKSQINEAFQKIKSTFNDTLSPEHGEKGSSKDDRELAPSRETYDDALSSDDSEELVPSSEDGEALLIRDDEEHAPSSSSSSSDKDAPLLVDGEELASSPEDDE
ncbi:hypothetical protein V6N13_065511 [Hibiscus sabdariffa]|uniref:Uncharacterized protein n=1 Tax=Hibiscus sabdariffa TaxID=183260 RepID=A0ABR2QQM1_9ROSI